MKCGVCGNYKYPKGVTTVGPICGCPPEKLLPKLKKPHCGVINPKKIRHYNVRKCPPHNWQELMFCLACKECGKQIKRNLV